MCADRVGSPDHAVAPGVRPGVPRATSWLAWVRAYWGQWGHASGAAWLVLEPVVPEGQHVRGSDDVLGARQHCLVCCPHARHDTSHTAAASSRGLFAGEGRPLEPVLPTAVPRGVLAAGQLCRLLPGSLK